MKSSSFKVQCYILVPAIFAGFTAMAALLTYQLMRNPTLLLSGMRWPVTATGTVLVGTAFLTGSLIIWLLLRPVELFMHEAERFVQRTDSSPETVKDNSMRSFRNMAPITHMLERVTEVLGNVEARSIFPNIIAPSQSMRAVLGLILKIAPTDSTVLLLGESGTGKELIARNIHALSKRSDKPFVAINCAGIPEGLLESELFGHEKGAFTGAYARKTGKFEAAEGGTVFLDEIADMPMVTQAKILRALQEREIERVGGMRPIKTDIRIIAATNKDLSDMVAKGYFREDLYFRIDVLSIRLPPLRERSEDIPLLATHLLRQVNPDASISPKALAALTAYYWPGNIRELKNVIESAAALAGNEIEPHHLSVSTMGNGGFLAVSEDIEAQNLDQRLNAIEKGMILEALNRCGGIQVRAAELLGIKERSLWHRIAKHHIDVAAFRHPQENLHAQPKPQTL